MPVGGPWKISPTKQLKATHAEGSTYVVLAINFTSNSLIQASHQSGSKRLPGRSMDGMVTVGISTARCLTLLLLGCALSRYLWDIDVTVVLVVLGVTIRF